MVENWNVDAVAEHFYEQDADKLGNHVVDDNSEDVAGDNSAADDDVDNVVAEDAAVLGLSDGAEIAGREKRAGAGAEQNCPAAAAGSQTWSSCYCWSCCLYCVQIPSLI